MDVGHTTEIIKSLRTMYLVDMKSQGQHLRENYTNHVPTYFILKLFVYT